MQGTGAHFPALAESHKLPIAVTCPLPDTDPQTQHGMTLAHDYRTQEARPQRDPWCHTGTGTHSDSQA